MWTYRQDNKVEKGDFAINEVKGGELKVKMGGTAAIKNSVAQNKFLFSSLLKAG